MDVRQVHATVYAVFPLPFGEQIVGWAKSRYETPPRNRALAILPTRSALRLRAVTHPTVRVHPTQLGLQDLPVVVLRQRVDEHIVLRPLEAGDVVETQRVERGAVGGADHVGDHRL